MDDHSIEVKGLYKIFGPNGGNYIQAVKDGMSKDELNAEHNHVLGLKNINIHMPSAKIQVIMGLSGSGKSTMIRHINRLIEPTVGEVIFQGEDVCQMSKADLQEFRRHKTAMVFQKFALLPHRTVIDNTLFGIELQGVARKECKDRAMHWLKRVGLEGFEDNYPNQLSGGMQQRVGLARALNNDADILLMDEAFSALDPLIRMDMQSILLELQEELHKTIVFITHDLDEALRLGDRIAILRDGEVIQQGTGQEIVLNPADAYIADFVKEVNRGRVIKVDTVMSSGAGKSAVSAPSGSNLEDVAKLLSDNSKNSANIVDDRGATIGEITMKAVIDAMVTPAKH
ncbi:MAG TPA: proline/glycine betaine ABC transporter ATP-binding protein [Rhodobacteraceae bacterium]|jgi:glycine betaine/proline transport system ATP-binding protein|nr:proline/glycine betaine ABC transporter ATP-binding protein [Paracoccaceae bacterium]